jgi:NAD(P)H-hydrate epimerase
VGLVTLATPQSCLPTVAGYEPSYMTIGLPDEPSGQIAAEAEKVLSSILERFTALACGPGLGRSPGLDRLVAWLYRTASQPLVIDADGLNALADQPAILDSTPPGPRILTPHPGEFARLAGERSKPIAKGNAASAADLARQLSAAWGVVIVLKGHQTLVTDGSRQWLNTTGNPGLATGGSGDVLTGLVTAFLCQGLSPYDAARLGVHVHGLAGDLAAEELGQIAMIASDLPRYFGPAFRKLGM